MMDYLQYQDVNHNELANNESYHDDLATNEMSNDER